MDGQLDVNGINLHVEQRGQGEPLLLIPGLGAGTWLWQHNVERLSRHFHLIMPELRGSGRSDKPDHPYSVRLFAQDMLALLDALNVPRAFVLGASLGGFVAQQLAGGWPERVRKLVLVATSLGGQCQIGPNGEILSRLIRPHGRTRLERLQDAYPLSFSADYIARPAEELERLTQWRLEHPQPEFAYYRQLLAGNAYHGERCAQKITAPTLLCFGRDDEIVPLANAAALREKIRHAQLVTFEGRHLFFYEHSRRFNQVVLDFLLAPVEALPSSPQTFNQPLATL
ncbi:MAG: alpha/beta hydrolase [candidate division KSB1 bacterium]|nr:alpha/beta hydrolase [candidate division KSB1 bacterium]